MLSRETQCPDVKNYKWRLNPVWHRMLYNCTHMAIFGIKGLSHVQCKNYTCKVFQVQTHSWQNTTPQSVCLYHSFTPLMVRPPQMCCPNTQPESISTKLCKHRKPSRTATLASFTCNCRKHLTAVAVLYEGGKVQPAKHDKGCKK